MANRNSANRKSTKPEPAPKTAAQRQANQPKRQRGSLKEYFKGVRLEMRKVVWPTRKELGSFTAVVLATCAAFALFFWGAKRED